MIISFVSAKGGSGKTSIAASSAKALSFLGLKVLLIDLDGATNGLSLLFLNHITKAKENNKNDLKGILEIDEECNEPSTINIDENLDLIPANYKHRILKSQREYLFLVEKIKSLSKKYDITIVDSQAGTEPLSKFAASIGDRVVLATEYDPMSAAGAERMKYLFRESMPPEKTYTLVNKILREFSKNYREFFSSVFKHLSPIPFDFDAIRAYAKRELAINMKKPNAYTISIIRMLKDLLPEESNLFDEWKSGIQDELNKPLKEKQDIIKEKISQTQNQLSRQKYRPDYAKMKFRRMNMTMAVLAMMVSMVIVTFYILEPGGISNMVLMITVTITAAAIGISVFIKTQNEEKLLKEKISSENEISYLEAELKRLYEEQDKVKSMIDSDELSNT